MKQDGNVFCFLNKEEVDKVNFILNDLYLDFVESFPDYEDNSLYTGNLGVALFYYCYSDINEVSSYHCFDLLEKIIDSITTSYDDKNNIMCICHLGQVLQIMCSENRFPQIKQFKSFLDDIDDILLPVLSREYEYKPMDFLSGSLNIAYYYLLRSKFDVLDLFILNLISEIENLNSNSSVNFGIAHGLPGALLFLNKLPMVIRDKYNISFIIDKGISFLINNNPLNFENQHVFRRAVNDFTDTKLAWCHGDLSNLYVLHVLAPSSNIKELSLYVSFLSEKVLKKSFIDNSAIDPCVCHGSASVAMLYCCLSSITHEVSYINMARNWLLNIIKSCKTDDNQYRFVSKVDYSVYSNKRGLLLGSSGVGLLLLLVIRASSVSLLKLLLLK